MRTVQHSVGWRYRFFEIFTCVYIFLSGFVFIEPSPAEFWFILAVPIFLIGFKTTHKILALFALIFLPMLVSTYVGVAQSGLFNQRFFMIDIYLFLLFFLLSSYMHTISKSADFDSYLDTLMRFWSIAGAINVLAGLFAYATGKTTLFGANVIRFGVRLTGFFKDPNVLGPFLVPIAVYFLMRFIERKGKAYLNLLLFFFFSYGVLLTFSRAAWLNYFTAVIILNLASVTTKKKKTRLQVIALLLFISVMSIFFWELAGNIEIFNTNLREFILARARFQGYDEQRFEAQSEFVNILTRSNIFFGAGPGNYEAFTAYSTHSLLVRYIGERGIFGFCTFLVFLLTVAFKTSKSKHRNFLIPVILGQLANSFFIDSLHWRHLWILLVLSLF
ncbi:hypothetical protein AS159_02590 [Thermotoga sp. Ku-13t]|nr:hypothetical protein AS159_02590 [Thermotoga sp. Ku-13t]